MGFFEVDKKGLAKLLERKGIEFILYELYQNAVDAPETTCVRIHLNPIPGQAKTEIIVADDSPVGFKRLSDAYTLFAESEKKGDVSLRGRFNFGEKLVLAMCSEAEIVTTTGGILFDSDGRHVTKKKTATGTEFRGVFNCTRDQFLQIGYAAGRLIVPQNIKAYLGGVIISSRTPVASFEASLQTVKADGDGVLRNVSSKTRVDLYEPLSGETACIYEMGIPVVESNDKYHYDVQQKIPLSMERDNVSPAYLRTLRTFALNATFSSLSTEDANASWARDAASDKRADPEAIVAVADKRFGEKRVSYDMSDPEANKIAVSKGYTLVHGSMGSADEWENLRRANAILPAGQVTPSPKPYGDGPMEKIVPSDEWTADMVKMANYALMLGRELLDCAISVKMTRAGKNFMACYGHRQLAFNLNGGCTPAFFASVGSVCCDSLLIHELAHDRSLDHLSEEYYDALTEIGAKFKKLALEKPEIFREYR